MPLPQQIALYKIIESDSQLSWELFSKCIRKLDALESFTKENTTCFEWIKKETKKKQQRKQKGNKKTQKKQQQKNPEKQNKRNQKPNSTIIQILFPIFYIVTY